MIDILLTTYNGESFLQEQIDSLLNQTYQDIRILIRDDGSTDKTVLIIEEFEQKYPDKICVISDSRGNLGCRKGFMELLKLSENDYIMFCDQDDVWLPNKIELTYFRMRSIEKKEQVPILIFSDLKVVDEELNILNESFWKFQKLQPAIACKWKKLLAQNVITGCTMMINKSAKQAVLPFDLDMMIHDQWIGVNIAKKGIVSYINEPTILYRQHGKNVAGAINFNRKYIIRKVNDLLEIIKFFRKASKYFEGITFYEIIYNKISINIKRINS